MIIKFKYSISCNQLNRKLSRLFIHEFVNLTAWANIPYTRRFKEDTPSNALAIWMGIGPMPTRRKGLRLTIRPGVFCSP
jgi:hypothetical protein